MPGLFGFYGSCYCLALLCIGPVCLHFSLFCLSLAAYLYLLWITLSVYVSLKYLVSFSLYLAAPVCIPLSSTKLRASQFLLGCVAVLQWECMSSTVTVLLEVRTLSRLSPTAAQETICPLSMSVVVYPTDLSNPGAALTRFNSFPSSHPTKLGRKRNLCRSECTRSLN